MRNIEQIHSSPQAYHSQLHCREHADDVPTFSPEQRITDHPGLMLNVCENVLDAPSYYLYFYDGDEEVANKVKAHYEYSNYVTTFAPVLHLSDYPIAL